ncbi:MAG: FmdB family transcriptional regulator [Acidimicrobiales bacterium]|nr:FmdB family transcriptional regulator [Acidimicrobiales bacterium]
MPTYQYRCTECEHQFEVRQSFSDDPISICPVCSGPVKKVFGNVGIAFKGSGFYKNDSRSSSGKSTGSASSGDSAKSSTTETKTSSSTPKEKSSGSSSSSTSD